MRWREAALGSRGELRPVPVEGLHVTLLFIGAIPARRVGELWEAALRAPRQARPRLTPAAVTAVPERRPRLFALDLLDEGDRAGHLHRETARALAAAGLHEPEARPFWPHVTLARVRRGERAGQLDVRPPSIESVPAKAMTLYRSHLSPRGARYEALERLELGS